MKSFQTSEKCPSSSTAAASPTAVPTAYPDRATSKKSDLKDLTEMQALESHRSNKEPAKEHGRDGLPTDEKPRMNELFKERSGELQVLVGKPEKESSVSPSQAKDEKKADKPDRPREKPKGTLRLNSAEEEQQPKKKNMQNIFDAMRDEGDQVVKGRSLKFLESPRVQLFLLIITLYALFADDYRYLTGRKAIDPVYDVFILICTGIFFVEIVVASVFKPGYFNSYYFYLDIVSTGSLILDFYPVKAELIIFG
jgi:hypothetical protein